MKHHSNPLIPGSQSSIRKKQFFTTLSLVMGVGAASAATILQDDFTGITTPTNSNVATIDSWNTINGVTAGTSFTAFTHTGANANYEDALSNVLDVDATLNLPAGTGWDVEFDVSLASGVSSIDLTTFELSSLVTNASGAQRNINVTTSWDWTLSITGDGAYGTQSVTDTMTIVAPPTVVNAGGALSIDASTLGSLVAGENYTFTVGVRFTGTGDQTFMALDSMSFDGIVTPVPEASSFALLGLSGLFLLRRRR